MTVTLTWHELFLATLVGVKRQIEALRKGKTNSHGFDGEEGWTVHIEGAAGEMAAAKAMGMYWSAPVNTFKGGGDVGKLQIRTRSNPNYDLIVREGDRDQDIFVLVTGRAPRFDVIGWIRGGDAKRAEWSKTHGGRPPAYFVPQDALWGIVELEEFKGISA
jgi:hypothetical protein